MIATFIALVFAHVVADYVLQPGWMVERKRNPLILLLHGLVILVVTHAAVGHFDARAVISLAVMHVCIDAAKVYGFADTLAAHLLDQVAHILAIIFVTFHAPDLWQTGSWNAQTDWLLHVMLLVAGAILATRAGSFALKKLMQPFSADFASGGLPNGGNLIGILERGLIYVLILSGQAAGVGFLIAAKSILRFEVATKQKAAEYVIVGTLASFGWAILIATATDLLLSTLPALVIGDVVAYFNGVTSTKGTS
ncbi:MAG: DUF3307 domain-containing protein [Pseudomonadota bacterium]